MKLLALSLRFISNEVVKALILTSIYFMGRLTQITVSGDDLQMAIREGLLGGARLLG